MTAAYKTAAAAARTNAVIIEKEVMGKFELLYDYAAIPDVMKLVKEFDLVIEQQDFVEGCRVTGEVKLRNDAKFAEKTILLQALGIKSVSQTPKILYIQILISKYETFDCSLIVVFLFDWRCTEHRGYAHLCPS